jgi:outer membrane receptor for ferrienterochelin and colicins
VISFQPGLDINIENGEGQRLKAGLNQINDYAFFVTSEITPSSKISIRPGLRFIKNSVYDAPPVIPSINAKFSLSKSLDLRLAYARGFRSPSLRELYFNFIDATHTVLGNPDLKAETSHSLTGSLAWKKATAEQTVYTVTLGTFYNDIKNLIDYALSTTSDTAWVANVSSSKTAGGNLVAGIRHNNWNLSAGMSYTGFYNDYSETDNSLPQLQWSPEANGSVGYTFSKIGLNANLFYKFTGKKPFYTVDNQTQAFVVAEMESYQMADITINKTFKKTVLRFFSLTAGIKNLFDTKAVRSTLAATGSVHNNGTGNNLAYGRSYFAGLVFNWDKK